MSMRTLSPSRACSSRGGLLSPVLRRCHGLRAGAGRARPVPSACQVWLRPAVQDAARLQPLARLRRAQGRPAACWRRRSRSSSSTSRSARAIEARDHDGDDQQPRHRARARPSRRCTSRPTSTATRSRAPRCALYTIWYLMENYEPHRRGHAARRRARVLHRAHRQPRRTRALPQGARSGAPHRARPGRRRQRRRRRRGRRRRPERQRRDRADPQVRAGAGHAPQERGGPAPARAGAGRARRATT